MRVTGRRLATGQDPNEVDAVVLEPRMVAQASVETLALSLPERLGIARRVALWHISWSEDLRSLCHLRLLAHSSRGRAPVYPEVSTCVKTNRWPTFALPVESVGQLGYHVHACPEFRE